MFLLLYSLFCTEYGLTTEGIFRVPGEAYAVDTFQRIFDSGATEVDFRGCSVHDVATLLKLYLRMLPEPLVPFKVYPSLVSIQSRFEEDDNVSKRDKELATLIKDMPLCNRRVLKYLLAFLKDLSDHHKQTKMNSSNLALVFVPNVVRPEKDTVDTAMQSPIVQRIFESLIENHEEIWKLASGLDSSIRGELEISSPLVEKHKKLQKVVSRYSMDAFDPMLCGEIPLPSTLTPKRNVRPKGARKRPITHFETVREAAASKPPAPSAVDDMM